MDDPGGIVWRKSSRSNASGGACVEVAAVWRKSSRSNGSGGHCVEVAPADRRVAVRDSKNPGQGHLTVSRAQFRTLTTRIKSGELAPSA